MSDFLTAIYPYIPIELSNKVLSSLIDVSIALFGFAGLISVFIFRNLLTTKGNLQREKLDVDFKLLQFEAQPLDTPHGLEARRRCKNRIKEINNDLARNKEQLESASVLSFASLGIAFVCILMNIYTFGAVGNKGLHFLNLTILLSLFFVWLDCVFKLIRTVIK